MKLDQLFSINGKTAVVTGGSRGIGEMITAGFLANGVKVYITARKAGPLIDKAKELSDQYGQECIAIPSDLSSHGGIVEFADELKTRESSVNFLINNAGAAWAEPLDTFSEEGWDRVMDLNVKSLFFVTQQFLPLLRANANNEDPSRIINVGSIDGINTPVFETYPYGPSKAAVHHLTRVLSAKLVKEDIIVNAIAPGPFPSNMLGPAVGHDYSGIAKANPRSRVGTPEDIAGLTIFLCSRAGAFTVGETITCDGGLVARSGHDLSGG